LCNNEEFANETCCWHTAEKYCYCARELQYDREELNNLEDGQKIKEMKFSS